MNNFFSSHLDFEVTNEPLFWSAPTGINCTERDVDLKSLLLESSGSKGIDPLHVCP